MILSKTARGDDLREIPKPDKIIILMMGQRAPWSGVLMDEDEFRYVKTIELEKEMMERRVMDRPTSPVWVFFSGLVLGALGASLSK
jgi:hypothetical protein